MAATRSSIGFNLNGRSVLAEVESHWNIIEMLQTVFGLTGARESCGLGVCGCCTVLIDGDAVTGCLQLAVLVDGKNVETIENFDSEGELSTEQKAFIETGALQCGYCTPGMILMTRKLLEDYSDPTDEDIRHYLSGNLCRCAAYPEIIAAVRLAARLRRT